jgi:hypothetical protein
MTTKEVERGKPKCARYWPQPNAEEAETYGNFSLINICIFNIFLMFVFYREVLGAHGYGAQHARLHAQTVSRQKSQRGRSRR